MIVDITQVGRCIPRDPWMSQNFRDRKPFKRIRLEHSIDEMRDVQREIRRFVKVLQKNNLSDKNRKSRKKKEKGSSGRIEA